jgi:NADH-quinone oxidoreductase subunit C/D
MMQALLDNLRTKFPDAILATRVDTARAETAVSVAAARLLDIARYLHDAPEAAFNHLTDICSVDYPEDQLRFEVVYHLHSLPLQQRLRLKARITEDDPTIASVTGCW